MKRLLTTRWNGPGMLRQKQEEIEIRVPGKACEGAIPGRSPLRTRDQRQLAAVRQLGQMPGHPVMNEKETKRRLAQLSSIAHDRELDLYLSELEKRFRDWREGSIGPSELSDVIHEFHDGPARGVYSIHSTMKRDQLVARAIGVGLLTEDEVPDEIRGSLIDLIAHFRDNYQIDEDDPLFRLRSRAISRGTEDSSHM